MAIFKIRNGVAIIRFDNITTLDELRERYGFEGPEYVDAEISLGDRLIDGVWQTPAVRLTPAQFAFLLAYTGLDDVWDAVEQQAKQSGNIGLYATLRAQRNETSYRLEKTLAFKNDPSVQQVIAVVAADADLSDATITSAWDFSALQSFDSVEPV